MSFITGKHLARRTFLRGMGATVALPFLDAMIPAGRLGRAAAAAGADVTRLVCIEEVHGLPGCNEWGASRHLFAPAAVGSDFELPDESALKPLEPFRDYLTIVSNTDVRMAEAFSPPEIGGDHFRSSAVFLTQSHPKQTQGSDLFVGTSLDQLYAQRFGQSTPMPSLELCIENLDQAGGCTYNYSCAYTDSISWSSPSEPLPMIRDPRVAFEMLFGAGGTPEERAERRATRRSILDWILSDVAEVRKELGAVDRRRLDRYLDDVREVERRIRMVEGRNDGGEPRELPDAPRGVPRLVLRAHAAPVRSPGAGARDRHDPRHLVQDRPRRPEPRLPRERHEPALPPRLAPRERRGANPRLQHDLPVPRRANCRTSSSGCGTRWRATRRCSTRRRSSGARRWPTPTSTTTGAAP